MAFRSRQISSVMLLSATLFSLIGCASMMMPTEMYQAYPGELRSDSAHAILWSGGEGWITYVDGERAGRLGANAPKVVVLPGLHSFSVYGNVYSNLGGKSQHAFLCVDAKAGQVYTLTTERKPHLLINKKIEFWFRDQDGNIASYESPRTGVSACEDVEQTSPKDG